MLWTIASLSAFVGIDHSSRVLSAIASIDWTLHGLIVVGLVLQSPYVPTLPGQCKHDPGSRAAGLYRIITAAYLKDFRPGKDADGNVKDPPTVQNTCEDFYQVWALGLAVV